MRCFEKRITVVMLFKKGEIGNLAHDVVTVKAEDLKTSAF